MEQQQNEHPAMELSSQLVTIMTTEHYNLRMALSMNTTEISGRSSLFVGAVSSALIALAFVGQVSHLGTAFFVFGLVVLAALVVMGLITFERVLESSNTQFMYARCITRIRHLYLEYAPQMQPYFIHATQSDPSFMLSSPNDQQAVGHEVMQPPWWQVFLSMAGMMAVINSVLAGSFVGLLLAAFTLPLWVCTSAGVVAFLVSLVLHQRYQWSQVMRVVRTMRDLFPSQPDMKHTKR